MERIQAIPKLFFSPLVLLLLVASLVSAGTYTRSSFPLVNDQVKDSSFTVFGPGIGLNVDRWEMVKLWGDSSLSPQSSSNNFSTVMAGVLDTFSYFWADTIKDSIYRKDVLLTIAGSTTLQNRAICSWPEPKYAYMHADKGANSFLLTYIDHGTGISKLRLVGRNDNSQIVIDSTLSNLIQASQCHFVADTFLVVSIVDWSTLTLFKVRSSGGNISILSSVVVANGSIAAGNTLLNCSVAADPITGLIAVTWIKGSPNANDKYMYYQIYNRNLTLKVNGNGQYASRVSDAEFFFNDEVPVASYAPGWFALVSWDPTGISLHKLNAQTNSLVAPVKIHNRAGRYHSNMTVNNDYLVVVSKADYNNNTKIGVEGIRFKINNTSLAVQDTFVFSNPNNTITTFDNYSGNISCAIDSTGSMASTWRDGQVSKGTIWANRGVRFKKAFWTSPVESLSVLSTDSVRYYACAESLQFITRDTTYLRNSTEFNKTEINSWFIEDSIKLACDPTDFSGLPWVSLSNQTILDAQKTNCHYFQYRLALNRKPFSQLPDSLSTPTLTQFTLPWDVQPVIVGIDSLFVNSVLNSPISFNDTISILSRSDTLRLVARAKDSDPIDTLRMATSWPARDSLVTLLPPSFQKSVRFRVISKSDTTVRCTFDAWDLRQWHAVKHGFTITTHNSVPDLNVSVAFTHGNGVRDTTPLSSHIEIQQEDSIVFTYSLRDSNDINVAKSQVKQVINGSEFVLDSTGTSGKQRYVISGMTTNLVDSILLRFYAQDPDTTYFLPTGIRINHPPVIQYFTYENDTINSGDTIRILVGDSVGIKIQVHDTDLTWWDTLTCRYSTRIIQDSIKTKNGFITIPFHPTARDTLVSLIVHDRYGRSDSVKFYLKFPWYTIDTVTNPGHFYALDTLRNGVSLIDGNDSQRVVVVPLVNTGNDTMTITSMRILGLSRKWFWLFAPQDTGYVKFSSDNARMFKPITLLPDSQIQFSMVFTARPMSGDSIIQDTIILATSDPLHPYDTIPLQLEYNDLPKIVNVSIDFSDGPYTSRLSKRQALHVYVFPPHATLGIQFSEPMDSASAVKGIKVFSIFDSVTTGSNTSVGLDYDWNESYTKVNISAHYLAPSAHFSIQPQAGLFIPTDSLKMVISSFVTDKATTPSGPNGLDVNLDLKRDIGLDTALPFRVDSITFTILSVTPRNLETSAPVKPVIEIVFSAPVYTSTVDTSLDSNRTFSIRSSYNEGKIIPFDSIAIDGNKVTFRSSITLFYNDSVWCKYRGASVKDLMGFPADNSLDGIPSTLFDTSSSVDDLEWSFHIKKINLLEVTPDKGESVKSVSPSVILKFSEKIFPGIFDLDTTISNKSFLMYSSYADNKIVSYISIKISPDSMQVTLTPNFKFFSNDSVNCFFKGFTKEYRYTRSTNLPLDILSSYETMSWYFYTGTIGFYTFPNPFKPSLDPRHCADPNTCGIWFKNLHALREGLTDVRISIFSINAIPVFDSKKAGIEIHFEKANSENKPQWIWNTNNQAGKPVGSGVYFYAIYDNDNKILVKGKLMIIR